METVYLNGLAIKVYGALPAVGAPAPAFNLVGQDLGPVTLDQFKGHRVVLNIFPSLDTDVCAASVRRFNQDAAKLPDTKVVCVSMDLPFAAQRFCSANGIDNVVTASGFRSDFGKTYGVEMTDGPLAGLYARALVVIDRDGTVMATSLCPQITDSPDYDLVFKTLG